MMVFMGSISSRDQDISGPGDICGQVQVRDFSFNRYIYVRVTRVVVQFFENRGGRRVQPDFECQVFTRRVNHNLLTL